MSVTTIIRDALNARYRAEIMEGIATFSVFAERPMGVANHADLLKDLDMCLQKVSEAQAKLNSLDRIMPIPNENETKSQETPS